jgi:hypothetical protein
VNLVGGAHRLLSKAAEAVARAFGRLRRRPRSTGPRRILVPFTRGHLDPTVLDAAIRITRAEDATLVPAYLILVPFRFALDAPMAQEVAMAIPLLEAVEHAAGRATVPVDARVESGRTPIHALARLWAVEHFDRIVVPAPAGRESGFTPKELLWMLTNAPSETLILRPGPPLHSIAEQLEEDPLRTDAIVRKPRLPRDRGPEAPGSCVVAGSGH